MTWYYYHNIHKAKQAFQNGEISYEMYKGYLDFMHGRNQTPLKNIIHTGRKVCTQYQPFKINDKKSVVCNFNCDGNCQFGPNEGYKYFKENL